MYTGVGRTATNVKERTTMAEMGAIILEFLESMFLAREHTRAIARNSPQIGTASANGIYILYLNAGYPTR
jgi:hypothetical protein